ncbi:MAG: hypothetical protein P3W90_003555, partial [Paracoccus sp. (in: a-proteobacteria)]|nr:hypothetical protein [Paracoccus sp. (in: a-proteobacteria)]
AAPLRASKKWVWISGPAALEMALRNDQLESYTFIITINDLWQFIKTAQATGQKSSFLARLGALPVIAACILAVCAGG